jgi:hypothetical protein
MILPILLLVPFAAGVLSAVAWSRRFMEAVNVGAFGHNISLIVIEIGNKRCLGISRSVFRHFCITPKELRTMDDLRNSSHL